MRPQNKTTSHFYTCKLLSLEINKKPWLCHKNNKDDKENNKDTKNFYHQPSIGCDTLKIFH